MVTIAFGSKKMSASPWLTFSLTFTVTNVYNEYQYSIEYGAVDPETAIQEMNDKMYAAGLQEIIDEKQRQYTAWREARGK